MIGTKHIEVSNRDAKFKFDLHRNITVVQGDSGTGKTTLFEMIADYTRLGADSGVNIKSEKTCAALVDTDWKNQLSNLSDSIVFIDEGFKEIRSKEFALAVKNSDNYYVIFNRESLHELPYSVDEIYEIKASGKYHSFVKRYKSNKKHIYSRKSSSSQGRFKMTVLLTEDSNSGFQFYKHYYEGSEIECYTSGSNAAVFKWLLDHKSEKVFVVADGAAFGSEIDRVLKLQSDSEANFRLCLPESFEWLILRSGLIKANGLSDMLDDPSEYVDSSKYFSWENFFEDYLIQNTLNTSFQYAKREINPIYLIDANTKMIIAEII